MKLQDLGIKLPKLPVSSVGSFPKPAVLKNARAQFERREITREQLTEIERETTKDWIQFQEEIGVDVLVDGEMYRGDMVAYFAENLAGFEKLPTELSGRLGNLIPKSCNFMSLTPELAM